ncbi:inositol monophosphatase [Alphaproteobacteria bacterium]|nr:inositol monophosphatase [Alphaproteobacteria bacterium]
MPVIDPNNLREILFNLSTNIIIPSFGNLKKNQISYKGGKDIVTDIDISVEDKLSNILPKLLKNSNFIGEETYSKNSKILNHYLSEEYCWTVDPIDGTSNFANSKETFAVMIALTKNTEIIQSFIYKPLTEDYMHADNTGVYLNDKKINLKKQIKIEDAIGSISTKYWEDKKKNKLILLKNKFKSINSYGSIGCEYFDIALGVRDFAVLSRLYPWDHIPGVFIVRQAGGHDCHFDKKEYKFYENSKDLIVSSSKNLNYDILNLIEGE